MIQTVEEMLGIKVRGFEWKGEVSKALKRHIIPFSEWHGEIYVRGKGIMALKEYYKMMIQKGYCLYINGWIVGKTGVSVHYNSLHHEYLKRLRIKQQENVKKNSGYPVVNPAMDAVFQSAVELYKKGIFSKEQLEIRVKRYILPEKQDYILNTILRTTEVA